MEGLILRGNTLRYGSSVGTQFASNLRSNGQANHSSQQRYSSRFGRVQLQVRAQEQASSREQGERQQIVRPPGRQGIVHIKSTKNNTIVTLTNMNGTPVFVASAGTVGFKNARKGTPYAAEVAAKAVAKEATNLGVTKVLVFVRGIGAGRENAIKGLTGDAETSGLEISLIRDRTRLPFNGQRPPKVRRV